MSAISSTITQTTTTHAVLRLSSDVSAKARLLILKLRGMEIFSEHHELLAQLEVQLEHDLPLALAHLYFRILASEAGKPFRAHVVQWFSELEGSIENFPYPQRWAWQILQTLRTMGKDPMLITHFENKLQHASFETYEQQEDFALTICCLLFQMEAMQEEFAALLAMTVPAGEEPLQFAQAYHRGRHEYRLVQQTKALEKRVEEATAKALAAIEKAAHSLLPKLHHVEQMQASDAQKVVSLRQQVLEKKSRLDQLAKGLLAL